MSPNQSSGSARATRHPVAVLAIAATFALAGALPAFAGPDPARKAKAAPVKPITVFAVRHAEKMPDGGRDPDLSEEGRARARMLADMLGSAGVTHLFASEYKRTQQTLEPLSAATGVRVKVIGAGNLAAQSEAIHGLPPGSVAVVAGHSNTVPDLVKQLGGAVTGLVKTEHGEMLDDATYDRIFQMILPPIGRAMRHLETQVLELRYPPPAEPASAPGAESPVEVEGGADHG